MTDTWFERAIFLSWYCSKGDCKFCYMSTQKERIHNPRLARRRIESVLAEAIITRAQGWKIEFLSGGYESYTREELAEVFRKVSSVYGDKLWINIGVLSEDDIIAYKPYMKGVCGAVETVNPRLHKELCPSKPISEIEEMFKLCDKHGIQKSMTIIIGLGESLSDFKHLREFILKHKISRITFYALNPHKGTVFTKGPDSEYYAKWVSCTRETFPEIEIIAGSWVNRLREISLLLKSGADAITKFPALSMFGTSYAEEIESEAKIAGRSFLGSMTKINRKMIDNYISESPLDKDLKEKVRAKAEMYLSRIGKKNAQGKEDH